MFISLPPTYYYLPPDPIAIIRNVAELEGFGEIKKLIKIAHCESGPKLNRTTHINDDGSIDRGIFQINNKWHPEVSDHKAYDVRHATAEAIRIQRRSGWSQWMCNNKI